MKRLTEAELRSIILSEIGPDRFAGQHEENTSSQSQVYPEMGKRLAETFLAMLSPEPQILSDLERELDHSFDQDAFFPTRIEDIEPMAEAAAKIAIPIIARSPDFQGLLADALARMFKKALRYGA